MPRLQRGWLVLWMTLMLASRAEAGLIAHWPLNEISGTTADDPVGGFDGILCEGTNCPDTDFTGWGVGKIGNGLNGDGVDDLVFVAHAATLNTVHSISFWFNADVFSPAGNGTMFISKGEWATTDGYWFGIRNVGGEHLLCGIGVAIVGTIVKWPLTNLSTGTWYHAVCAADVNGQELFVDGVSRVSNATARATITHTAGIRMFELSLYNLPHSPYNGWLDQVKLFDHRLTLQEVQTLFAEGSARRRSRSPQIME